MFFTRYIGIDLGTANTLVFLKGKGIVLREPSVVAVDSHTGAVLAVGTEAKRMIGRTPGNITAIRPVKDGVIADFDYTQSMLKYFIRKSVKGSSFMTSTKVVICMPSGITAVEERAVREAALAAGAKEAHLVEEPLAAACGVGLPVYEPTGNMIVDIGGGTTEVAIVSLGGIVTVRSIRVAGDAMDAAIVSHLKKTYNMIIGDRTAEAIKIELGNAYLDDAYRNKTMDVRGRDTISGLPRTISVTAREMNIALSEPIGAIVEAIKTCLEKAPPELSADIMDKGIILAGGGSLIHGLPTLVSNETGIMCHLSEDPLTAVVMGVAMFLDNVERLKRHRFNYAE